MTSQNKPPATVSVSKPPVAPTVSKDPTKTSTLQVPDTAFMLEELEDSQEWLKMVIYGPYGTGKTTLAATAADVDEMADVLLVDAESGKMTLRDNKRIRNKSRIMSIRITSFKQMSEVHKFLKAHCRFRDDSTAVDKLIRLQAKFAGVDPASIKTPKRFKTVIIDSLSEIDSQCMYELLGYATDMDLDTAMNGGDVEVADWGEYKKNNLMMQLIVRAFRDLPVNVLFVCHAAYNQDEKKRMFYNPALTGKLANQVQGFVDLVGYLVVGQVTEGSAEEAPRRMYIQPVGQFAAKNRLQHLTNSFLTNPTMKDIWEGM